MTSRILRFPRSVKRFIAILVDALTCGLAIWLALYLRLEQWVLPTAPIAWAALVSVGLAVPVFWAFKLYAPIFRYSGWNATLTVAKACMTYGVLFALIYTFMGVSGVPRTVGIIQPLLVFIGVSVSRLAVRLLLGDLYRRILNRRSLPGVLIYGAGSAGRQLASALAQSPEHRLVGFVDDDRRMQGRAMDGWPIYAPSQLGEAISRHGVSDVLLAMPSLNRKQRLAILDTLRPYPLHVRTLPGVAELASGEVSLKDVHELDIADLLGRDAVAPDVALLNRHVRGQVVMVTGAGGSIGSELCRQILRCRPTTLLLLDNSEPSLYQISSELERLVAADAAPASILPLLGSVADEKRLVQIMATWRPSIVYHAAAYKHVPLVEHNMLEGVRNNVFGTLACARAALALGVRNLVLISTDKAVRPTNVMGASKRLAEMVLQALAREAPASHQGIAGPAGSTCLSMVRFGNVLGSSGSVVPLFRQQIAQGGPITLTHADITRYFMTIPEASQLVMQAGAMAQGGEVFVLDMGEPVRIHDLAVRMVELCGLRVRDAEHPSGDIEIKVTGLRPGEKLYEELLIGDGAEPTHHERIMKAHEGFVSWAELQLDLEKLHEAIEAGDLAGVRSLLERLVSGYRPAQGLVDWVHLAGRLSGQDGSLQVQQVHSQAGSELRTSVWGELCVGSPEGLVDRLAPRRVEFIGQPSTVKL